MTWASETGSMHSAVSFSGELISASRLKKRYYWKAGLHHVGRLPVSRMTIPYGNRYEKLILALAEFGIPENQFWELDNEIKTM
jgi:hypothetical protein